MSNRLILILLILVIVGLCKEIVSITLSMAAQ